MRDSAEAEVRRAPGMSMPSVRLIRRVRSEAFEVVTVPAPAMCSKAMSAATHVGTGLMLMPVTKLAC